MQKSRILRLRTPLIRRFVGFLTIATYLVVCTGLPVPFVVGQASASEEAPATPYPCQGHRCGCRSAEQCWKACCCMSDLEKRLWAERNGVSLPDYLLAQPEAAVITPAVRAAEEPRGCCRKASGRSPAAAVAKSCGPCPTEAATKSSACGSPANSGCSHSQASLARATPASSCEPNAAQAASRVEWVSYLAAQRCSGGATDVWHSGPTSLPVASCLVSISRLDEIQPFVPAAELATEATFSFPPQRPPRIV